MKQSSKLFSAFLLGAATGALLAPEKGSELRKKVSKNAANLMDQIQDTIANPKGKFDDLKAQIIEKANSLKDEWAEANTKSNGSRKIRSERRNRKASQ